MTRLISNATASRVRFVSPIGMLVALTVGLANTTGAQSTAPVEIRGATWTSPLREPVRWLGDVTSCGFVDCEQSATFGIEAAPRSFVRMSASGTASRQPFAWSSPQNLARRADLFIGGTRGTVWGGVLTSDARAFGNGARAVRRAGFEYGAALHLRDVAVSVSLGSGAIPGQTIRSTTVMQTVYNFLDSATNRWTSDTVRTYAADSSVSDARWSSAELRLMWSRPRWSVTAVLGRTAARADPALWGGFEAAAVVRRGAAVVLGGGVSSGTSITSFAVLPSRRVASLGLRLSTGLLGGGAKGSRTGSADAAFRAVILGDGRYRLALRLDAAARVELASDCTGWRPVAMVHRGGNLWEIDLPITPGVHHVNIRIDDGAWSVPPSLTTTDDDFAGEVGVFVVE